MIIIKLGGSVITRKREYATMNSGVVRMISEELSGYAGREPMIIIHGAGSFGHILAKEYGLKDPTPSDELPMGIARVQRDVRHLNLMVVEELVEHGIPAVSVPPALCTGLYNGDLAWFEGDIFQKYLDLGTVPVTFGDVVPDAKRGVSILSGDVLMERLAKEFDADRAVFVLDVDGFFDRQPDMQGAAVFKELTVDELGSILRTGPVSSKNMNEVVDITGSILGKMESALRIARGGTDTYLVNGQVRDRLTDVLNANATVSTMIKGKNDDNQP